MTKYFTTAETAKLIRTALKESFPGVKFSVKSHTYSGGSSINVRWIDGPTCGMVESVANTFKGAYFDGMQDYKGSTKAMIDGQVVKFGADFIFCHREVSPELDVRIKAAFVRKYGNMDNDFWFGNFYGKFNCYLAPRKSKTAGKVIYLGNDGYSNVGALNVD